MADYVVTKADGSQVIRHSDGGADTPISSGGGTSSGSTSGSSSGSSSSSSGSSSSLTAEQKRYKNIQQLAAYDPSYKQTVSYQKAAGQTQPSGTTGTGAYTGTYGAGQSPFEQLQSGQGSFYQSYQAGVQKAQAQGYTFNPSTSTNATIPSPVAYPVTPGTTPTGKTYQIGGYTYEGLGPVYSATANEGKGGYIEMIGRKAAGTSGTYITRPLYDEATVSNVFGEAVGRGMVKEDVIFTTSNVVSEKSFLGESKGNVYKSTRQVVSTPTTIGTPTGFLSWGAVTPQQKEAITKKVGESGFAVKEDSGRIMIVKKDFSTPVTAPVTAPAKTTASPDKVPSIGGAGDMTGTMYSKKLYLEGFGAPPAAKTTTATKTPSSMLDTVFGAGINVAASTSPAALAMLGTAKITSALTTISPVPSGEMVKRVSPSGEVTYIPKSEWLKQRDVSVSNKTSTGADTIYLYATYEPGQEPVSAIDERVLYQFGSDKLGTDQYYVPATGQYIPESKVASTQEILKAANVRDAEGNVIATKQLTSTPMEFTSGEVTRQYDDQGYIIGQSVTGGQYLKGGELSGSQQYTTTTGEKIDLPVGQKDALGRFNSPGYSAIVTQTGEDVTEKYKNITPGYASPVSPDAQYYTKSWYAGEALTGQYGVLDVAGRIVSTGKLDALGDYGKTYTMASPASAGSPHRELMASVEGGPVDQYGVSTLTTLDGRITTKAYAALTPEERMREQTAIKETVSPFFSFQDVMTGSGIAHRPGKSADFAWFGKTDIGVKHYEKEAAREFFNKDIGETDLGEFAVSRAIGGGAYLVGQGAYLAADTAITILAAGGVGNFLYSGVQAVAKEGVVKGLAGTAWSGIGKASTILGSPTYLVTGLIPEKAVAGKVVPLIMSSGTKAAVASAWGGGLLTLAAGRQVGILKSGTPLGDIGQGVLDIGGKYGRYITLQSLPGERMDIVTSATAYNFPFYGMKAAGTRASTTGTFGPQLPFVGGMSPGGAVNKLYQGANILGAGLIGYKHFTQVAAEEGKPNIGRAFGRTMGELGIFEYKFEAQTSDTVFESTRAYKWMQSNLEGMIAAKKINPQVYSTYWSSIERAPKASGAIGKGFDMSVKPGATVRFTGAPDVTVKQSPVTFGKEIKVQPPSTAKESFIGSFAKTDIKTEGVSKMDIRSDTKIEYKTGQSAKIDLRFPTSGTKPEEYQAARATSLTPDYGRIGPTIKLDTKIDLKEDTKLEPIKPDEKPDTKIDTKIDIGDPAILFGPVFAALGGGAGTGHTARSGMTRISGSVMDLLSVEFGAKRVTGSRATAPSMSITTRSAGRPRSATTRTSTGRIGRPPKSEAEKAATKAAAAQLKAEQQQSSKVMKQASKTGKGVFVKHLSMR